MDRRIQAKRNNSGRRKNPGNQANGRYD